MDCQEIQQGTAKKFTAEKRKKQQSQTHHREIMGDVERSKIQGKKGRKCSRRSGEQNGAMEERQWISREEESS